MYECQISTIPIRSYSVRLNVIGKRLSTLHTIFDSSNLDDTTQTYAAYGCGRFLLVFLSRALQMFQIHLLILMHTRISIFFNYGQNAASAISLIQLRCDWWKASEMDFCILFEVVYSIAWNVDDVCVWWRVWINCRRSDIDIDRELLEKKSCYSRPSRDFSVSLSLSLFRSALPFISLINSN